MCSEGFGAVANPIQPVFCIAALMPLMLHAQDRARRANEVGYRGQAGTSAGAHCWGTLGGVQLAGIPTRPRALSLLPSLLASCYAWRMP